MAVKTDRVEMRVSPEQRDRIERAAALSGASMSSFVVAAAVRRADEVISEHASTVVPVDYFDKLLAALNEPAEPSPRLQAAARAAQKRRRIRPA
jgi:uncharacterized protein (DUF1778 family)